MKTYSQALKFGLCALALGTVATQGAQFFRVAGPVATTITALSVDGYITWTNSPTNATFTVQTAASLLSESNWVDYIRVPATNGVTTNRLYDPNPPSGMALIPAGSFTMGNCMDPNEGYSSEQPLHTVYVSAFYMDANLVTYSLWTNVYQWATNHGYSFDNAGSGKAANYPVQMIDWYDTMKWCNARSEMEGRVPAYYTNAAQTAVYRSGTNDLASSFVNWSSGYRLPTEAEWEKAARGGLSGQRFPWGDTISESQANYNACTTCYSYDLGPYNGENTNFNNISPAGYFAPNGYGLYDMAGNVREWCWDSFDTLYYFSFRPDLWPTNPRGPAQTLTSRVLRGGMFVYVAKAARCASRDYDSPNDASPCNYVGFRSVREL